MFNHFKQAEGNSSVLVNGSGSTSIPALYACKNARTWKTHLQWSSSETSYCAKIAAFSYHTRNAWQADVACRIHQPCQGSPASLSTMLVKFTLLTLLFTLLSVQLRDPLGSVMQRLGCLVAPSFHVPGQLRQPRSTLARVATGALNFSIVASGSGAVQSEASWLVRPQSDLRRGCLLAPWCIPINLCAGPFRVAPLRTCRRWPRIQVSALSCLDPGTARPHCLQAARMAMC